MNRLFLLVSFIMASGCSSSPGAAPASSSTSSASQPSVAALGDRVNRAEEELKQLQEKVASLESTDAYVSTDEETYGVARTRFGPFTVVARSVTPYLDGYRVRLSVGNLTGAAFQGAKVRVIWGYDAENPGEFLKARREKTFDVTAIFAPGAHTRIEVTLTPAKANEIKRIWVGIDLSTMSLRGY